MNKRRWKRIIIHLLCALSGHPSTSQEELLYFNLPYFFHFTHAYALPPSDITDIFDVALSAARLFHCGSNAVRVVVFLKLLADFISLYSFDFWRTQKWNEAIFWLINFSKSLFVYLNEKFTNMLMSLSIDFSLILWWNINKYKMNQNTKCQLNMGVIYSRGPFALFIFQVAL